MTSAKCVSVPLQVWLVLLTLKSVFLLLLWAVVTFCQRLKKVQSMRLNGAARKPDSVFGFQKVLKHYYLQGLHQVVVNADMYVNGDFYDGLTDLEKKALEVAANASLSKSMSYRIYENGKALKDLTDNHGVILEDTPADYFTEYMAAAKKSLQAASDENAFFAEVWQSQKDFADVAVPFWAGAQASNASLGKAHADTLK